MLRASERNTRIHQNGRQLWNPIWVYQVGQVQKLKPVENIIIIVVVVAVVVIITWLTCYSAKLITNRFSAFGPVSLSRSQKCSGPRSETLNDPWRCTKVQIEFFPTTQFDSRTFGEINPLAGTLTGQAVWWGAQGPHKLGHPLGKPSPHLPYSYKEGLSWVWKISSLRRALQCSVKMLPAEKRSFSLEPSKTTVARNNCSLWPEGLGKCELQLWVKGRFRRSVHYRSAR